MSFWLPPCIRIKLSQRSKRAVTLVLIFRLSRIHHLEFPIATLQKTILAILLPALSLLNIVLAIRLITVFVVLSVCF